MARGAIDGATPNADAKAVEAEKRERAMLMLRLRANDKAQTQQQIEYNQGVISLIAPPAGCRGQPSRRRPRCASVDDCIAFALLWEVYAASPLRNPLERAESRRSDGDHLDEVQKMRQVRERAWRFLAKSLFYCHVVSVCDRVETSRHVARVPGSVHAVRCGLVGVQTSSRRGSRTHGLELGSQKNLAAEADDRMDASSLYRFSVSPLHSYTTRRGREGQPHNVP